MSKAYINALSEGSKREILEWLVKVDAENDALRERIKTLETVLPEAVAHVWQPIETAPRDEETILLRVPTLYGKWNETLPLAGRWEQRDPPSSGFWIIFNADEAVQRVEPTHWMPLPSSPMNKEQS